MTMERTNPGDLLNSPENRSKFLMCVIVYTFSLLPIFLSYRIQQDDLGRSIQDYRSWTSDGRPTAYFLQYLLNLGGPLVNLFPLYQFISIGLFSVSAVLIAKIFSIKSSFYLAIATLPLIAQPYFLQVMSYAFDSLSISAAILLAVGAVAVLAQSPSATQFVVSFLLLFASLATYQPAAITFALLYFGALLYQITLTGWQKNIARIIIGLLIISISLFVYFICLRYRLFGRLDSYAVSHMEVFSLREFASGVFANVTSYWGVLLADWSGTALGWIALTLGIAVGFCLVLPSLRGSGNCRLTGRFAALLGIGVLTLVSMGHLLIKQDPALVPRWFVGVGVTLSLFNLILVSRIEQGDINAVIRSAGLGLVLLLAYATILVAFAYGQARSAQKDFEAALLVRLVGDATPMLNDDAVSEVVIVGTMPRSPLLAWTARKYPVLDRLVVRHFRNEYIFGQLQLKYYGVNLVYGNTTSKILSQIENNESIVVNGFQYRLHIVGKSLIIEFPNEVATVSAL